MDVNNNLTLVFDFDGTIVDIMGQLDKTIQIYNRIAMESGFRIVDKSEVETLRSMGSKDFFKSLNVPVFKLPKLIKSFQKEMKSNIGSLKPVAGINKVLKKLHKNGFKMGILTSNSRENVEIFLRNHDLEVFDFIYSGSSAFGKDKVMKKMIKEQGLVPVNVIYFGDETRDVEASHKVGFRVMAVSWGMNNEEVLRERGADWVVTIVEEISVSKVM